MLIYQGGMKVMRGTYWNPADGHRVDVRETEGSVLPGDGDTRYFKLPPGGIIVIAPVFGLMYVIFLPLFGIGTFLMLWFFATMSAMAAVVMSAVKVCNGYFGRTGSFGWTPSASYLAGRRSRKAAAERLKQNTESEVKDNDTQGRT